MDGRVPEIELRNQESRVDARSRLIEKEEQSSFLLKLHQS
jgi:hypothetical protein